MSLNKLSVKDKNEIEKFTRSLALKFAQVIVQSRLGEKIHTSCNPLPRSTGSDWVSKYLIFFEKILIIKRCPARNSIYGRLIFSGVMYQSLLQYFPPMHLLSIQPIRSIRVFMQLTSICHKINNKKN